MACPNAANGVAAHL